LSILNRSINDGTMPIVPVVKVAACRVTLPVGDVLVSTVHLTTSVCPADAAR
jgi:hypothetical protein